MNVLFYRSNPEQFELINMKNRERSDCCFIDILGFYGASRPSSISIVNIFSLYTLQNIS